MYFLAQPLGNIVKQSIGWRTLVLVRRRTILVSNVDNNREQNNVSDNDVDDDQQEYVPNKDVPKMYKNQPGE